MTGPIRVACSHAEIVVECAAAAAALELSVVPSLERDPWARAGEWLERDAVVGVADGSGDDAVDAILALAARARATSHRAAAALLAHEGSALWLAGDTGIVGVRDIRPLTSALALLSASAEEPIRASTRGLAEVDRRRLGELPSPAGRSAASLVREDGGLIGLRPASGGAAVKIGEARDAALALAALRAAEPPNARPSSIVEGVDERAVMDVIFGPPRALSDPASKAALAPYGVPFPLEELCTSPSRAAAEAQRIGFPVRIALASPDLRVWDHPDLAVDGVDNAARVRDLFRQMTTLAGVRAPKARLLGVTVTATATARALLRVAMRPGPGDLVVAEIGFADPHGVASGDRTLAALPAPISRVEQVIARLGGASLVLDGGPAARRATVEAVADVLLRVAAFTLDRRAEVERVEIAPLAVLLGGRAEVREACVTVSDAFLRSLDQPA